MTPLRTIFDGVNFTRHNVFPMTESQAERQEKNLLDAGFKVKITHMGRNYFVWRAE